MFIFFNKVFALIPAFLPIRNDLLLHFPQCLDAFSSTSQMRYSGLIETVNDQLKKVCQIEHSRHRSPMNFVINLLTALITYTEKEKKPSLNLEV